MPRHGNTRTRERGKHQGHRVHKRTRVARALALRNANRQVRPWDRAAWHEWMHEQDMPVPFPEPLSAGRNNQSTQKPQNPKSPKGGSKGGNTGGGRKQGRPPK